MAIINRLRFVDILRPSLGDQTSREFADALQEEMDPLVRDRSLQLLLARMDTRMAQLEVRLQRFILGALGIGLAALGIVTAILLTQG